MIIRAGTTRSRLGAIARGVHIGPRPGQDDAVQDVDQMADILGLGHRRDQQRLGAGDLGHRLDIAAVRPLPGRPRPGEHCVSDDPDSLAAHVFLFVRQSGT